MCRVHLKDRKGSTDFLFMLGLNETIDQLAMANSVRWYGHVLRREDGKKGRLRRTWKKQVEEESVKVCLRREDTLYRSKWSVGVNRIVAGLR